MLTLKFYNKLECFSCSKNLKITIRVTEPHSDNQMNFRAWVISSGFLKQEVAKRGEAQFAFLFFPSKKACLSVVDLIEEEHKHFFWKCKVRSVFVEPWEKLNDNIPWTRHIFYFSSSSKKGNNLKLQKGACWRSTRERFEKLLIPGWTP
jgi:hypothetical protein